MLMHKTDKILIYFGDARDCISKSFHCVPSEKNLVDIEPFKSVTQKINVPRLSALNQTHSTKGTQIHNEDISFTIEGDYLVTNQLHIGLGVLTADCVPVILYDAKNHAISAVHAGWRGTVAGIVSKAFEHMNTVFNTRSADVQLFIGPSAKDCCYQVQEDFVQYISSDYLTHVMIKKDEHWYFDTVQLIKLQMQKAGISPAFINKNFNFCTICDHRFFSHRRQGVNAGRQITIACLK